MEKTKTLSEELRDCTELDIRLYAVMEAAYRQGSLWAGMVSIMSTADQARELWRMLEE